MSEEIKVDVSEIVMIKLGSIMLRILEETSEMIGRGVEREFISNSVFLNLEICRRAIFKSLNSKTIEEVDEIFKKETDSFLEELLKVSQK